MRPVRELQHAKTDVLVLIGKRHSMRLHPQRVTAGPAASCGVER